MCLDSYSANIEGSNPDNEGFGVQTLIVEIIYLIKILTQMINKISKFRQNEK